jgi:tRNA1Val (adenine37-N6)-methyltransferase
MSNSWFSFKQFTIQQEKAAMKVCTDACLFGAWVADTLKRERRQIENVLDIGTGTGLLTLMLAQKVDANIDAVEIDETAAQQAKENFEQSTYKERLQIIQGDIRTLQLEADYSLIISNPPFFEKDLKSDNSKRNVALHGESLTLEELIISSKKVLKPDGLLAILIPFSRTEELVRLAGKYDLYPQKTASVKQTEKHTCFRSMFLFDSHKKEIETSEIIIKIEGQYSQQFIALLKDYYLFL